MAQQLLHVGVPRQTPARIPAHEEDGSREVLLNAFEKAPVVVGIGTLRSGSSYFFQPGSHAFAGSMGDYLANFRGVLNDEALSARAIGVWA